ncbi:unnamed protein product [Rotaria sordida]|nr:unnamed protein product [Rotaria sordida]
MLEQNYLDKFKPFQCPNIINNEESNVSSVESHTDYCVELEVIWSIKNNSQVTSEQILYTAPVLSVSKSIDSTQSEQSSDAAYISPESKIPVTSTIGKAYPLSTILEFNNITGYDTNIQINSPLSPSNVYPTTNSKSNACQLLSITTNENLGCNAKDSTGNDDDFNMKPCFGDTDCDEIYRTAHKGPEIGRGSYGIVSLYVTRTKRMIAVKEIKLDEDDSERLCGDFKWVQEVYILRALDHPYVVKFYGISIENSRLEYVPNGTVDNMLKLFGPFPNNVLQKYTRQIVEGVAYLHDEGVIHR